MSRLDANAKEWRPSADYMGPLELPSSSEAKAEMTAAWNGAATAAPAKPAYDADAPEFIPSYARAPPADQSATSAPEYATASSNPFGSAGLPSYAALAAGGGADTGIDWAAEFTSVMALTGQLIHNQRFGEPEAAAQATPSQAPPAATPDAETAAPETAAPAAAPKLSYAAVVSSTGSGSTPAAPAVTSSQSRAVGAPSAAAKKTSATPSPATTPASLHPSVSPSIMGGGGSVSEAGRPRHWKKQTKGQQRREWEQKNAFESFANALLHSVSPFMAPLRARCQTSLPHLKLDQRFGKSGQPQTAIAQFVVAPLVTNYRPRHFHDVTPGDLMEFHYDLSQVLRVIPSSKSLHIGYGAVWKRFAIPYLYLACGQYRKEVLSLCPDEVPNSRAEAIYEDDVVKDITEVVLAVEELKPLQSMSIREAMRLRVNLAPLYDAFEAVFQPLENYMIEITDFDKVPSTFLLKTSKLEVEQKPQPIVLYGDETLWYELPVVSRVVQLGGGVDADGAHTTTSGADAQPAAQASQVTAPISAQSRGLPGAEASTADPRNHTAAQSGGAPGVGVDWMLVVPLALSACAVAATAAVLVMKKNK